MHMALQFVIAAFLYSCRTMCLQFILLYMHCAACLIVLDDIKYQVSILPISGSIVVVSSTSISIDTRACGLQLDTWSSTDSRGVR